MIKINQVPEKAHFHCARCGKAITAWTMSFFNKDIICPECKEEEKTFPEYPAAKKAELNAVKNKNYNFAGIGLPQKYVDMYASRRRKSKTS